MGRRIALALGLAFLGWSGQVAAQAPEGAAGAVSGSSGGATPQSSEPLEVRRMEQTHSADPFMRRHRPTRRALEAGLFAGGYWVSDQHNQLDPDVAVTRGHEELGRGGELGLRLALFPLSYLGVELEGGLILNDTERVGDSTETWIARGHGILQLPLGRLVPFVLGGGGLTSLRASGSLGNDRDPVIYFGGGLKFAVTQHLSVRVDLRDNLAQKNKLRAGVKDGDLVHNPELLAGLSLTLGRTPWTPMAPSTDTDNDGVDDARDRCPTVAGPAPNGCPLTQDADGDGVPDSSDFCPTEPEDGTPPVPQDGCPNRDIDGDDIPIPTDKCPAEAGVAPDGCPLRDEDGDGLLEPHDRCPKEAETRNKYEDDDGCPDELPEAVQKFVGVIKGILFPTGKATVRPASFPLLSDAATVLEQYPALRLRISGHTDSTGDHDRNRALSEQRAAAIKTYLTAKGIDASRIETRGAGPDEPIADNKTPAGKAQNRRIEFELLP